MNSTSIELPDTLIPIFEDLIRGYNRANKLHPEQAGSLYEICAILSEETGEVSNAVIEYMKGNGDREQIKRELIDTAAVCIRALEYLRQ